MKTLKTIIAIVALSIATVLPTSANNEKDPSGKSELRTKIVNLLGQHTYKLNKQLTADVSLMLNNKNELVIISVDSEDQNINNYVKLKLNYKKINIEGITKGTIYTIPLRMTQDS